MILSRVDAILFYQIRNALAAFVNDKMGLYPYFGHPKYDEDVDEKQMSKLLEEVWNDTSWIDKFIKSRNSIPKLWLKILKGWKEQHKTEVFLVMRQYKQFTVFYRETEEHLWGVQGISTPIAEYFDFMPCFLETTLLPFKNQIIYDSFLKIKPLKPVGNMRQRFIEQHERVFAEKGVQVSMNGSIPNVTKASLNDTDDITDEFIEEDEDDKKPLPISPEYEFQVQRLIEENPEASIAEINEMLKPFTEAENSLPKEEFYDLSANQMRALLDNPYSDDWIKLKPGCDQAGGQSVIVREIRYILEMLEKSGPIKLTAAGKLPTKAVREIYDQNFVVPHSIEEITRKYQNKTIREDDVRLLVEGRLLCEAAKLTRVSSGKLYITETGREALREDTIFSKVFRAYCDEKYNWGALRKKPLKFRELTHEFYAYIFYIFSKYGDVWHPTSFFAEKYRKVILRRKPNPDTDVFYDMFFGMEVFDDFLIPFGLAELNYGRPFEDESVKASQLFRMYIEITP